MARRTWGLFGRFLFESRNHVKLIGNLNEKVVLVFEGTVSGTENDRKFSRLAWARV